ncbi:hypothetical protein LTR82_014917 [Friedmanniomyces endolithicus]|uniref:Uncharacterized protein n=1 Tax=Friedmanniomyces endolithicus TaxID=329885 RepID=A0AAN6J275_9PEZI|nr:hypothetical protein LTR82_014917 [Friedmanniomyces endolithicus]
MSVNVPVNAGIKEKDINAKLQLYGIFAAFANGKVPSNKQIDVAMNSALQWNQLRNPPKSLSTEGQALIGDLRNVMEQAKTLLLTKNDGNLLQDFIWQTQHLDQGNAGSLNAPLDRNTAKQHGNQALEGLRTLGELLITNGQFRKLLSDATVLLRDIAGDAAQKAANRVNPSDEQLQQLDEAAPDNTWHDKPDLSRDTLRQQVQSRMPIGKKDLQDAAGDATQQAHPSGERDPQRAAETAANDAQQGTDSGYDAQGGAKAGLSSLKNKIQANASDEQKQQLDNHKQNAKEYRDRTNNYFKTKVPKERREQIVFRLKKMVVEIQGHQDYQQAIDTLLRLAEEYTGHTKSMAGQGREAVKGAHDQTSLQAAEADLKTLLERFANNTSFDDLLDSFNQIYSDADRDPELKGWFRDMDRYVRKCLKEPGFILEDDADEQWNRLYEHGNYLLRDRYKHHTDRIFDEFKHVAGQYDEDPQNKRFANSMQKLFNDLGNDENGKPTFKPHLLKDFTEVILPGFFEHIRYVPIPRTEYSDPMFDAVVENLVIEGDNLTPNMFEFGSDNYWRWGRKGIASKNKNKVMLNVSGVQMDLRDVAYYVKKKEGFPGVTDKGVMDIFLGGTGLSFKVAMETADNTDQHHFFKINTVVVDIKNLNIKLKQSNHKLLFALFKPLLLKVMRPIIQKVAEKQIRDNIQQLDAMAFRIKREADRAQEEAMNNPDPEHIQNMYQRYFTAFQQQMQKGQQKKEQAKAAASDKKVNVAITKYDSIFKNISLPGGISTKATEYRELAAKGDRWESPVFSIGSGRESSRIASAGMPSRRNQGVNNRGVQGVQGLEGNTLGGGDLTGQRLGGMDGATTGGYGAATGGYGNASGGLGNTGAGYENTGAGYGNTGGGFANQVNDAFAGDKSQGLGLNGGAGASGLTGATGTGTGIIGDGETGGTYLGRDNPVLRGQV